MIEDNVIFEYQAEFIGSFLVIDFRLSWKCAIANQFYRDENLNGFWKDR